MSDPGRYDPLRHTEREVQEARDKEQSQAPAPKENQQTQRDAPMYEAYMDRDDRDERLIALEKQLDTKMESGKINHFERNYELNKFDNYLLAEQRGAEMVEEREAKAAAKDSAKDSPQGWSDERISEAQRVADSINERNGQSMDQQRTRDQEQQK